MIRDLTALTRSHYDLIVVGGGINGAAIAYMASAAGKRVALLEKGDFASGTSSKSTKLLHGGIRYLENLEFDLVAEALKERYIQYKNAPHLVKTQHFIIPVYKGDQRPLWMMRLGVWLYDLLSGPYTLGKRQTLDAAQIKKMAEGIKEAGLIGGVAYYDAQMDDVRICIENVLMAESNGAVAVNYCDVTELIKINGRCCGVRAKDTLTGKSFDVMADEVIVTAGPWSNELISKDDKKARPRLRLTKGVHVLYRGQLSKEAFLIQSKKDRRIFFIIPFREHSLIGTTDTDYQGPIDQVAVEEEDIDYLLDEAGRVFPGVAFSKEEIITTFAGLRPLVHDEGVPGKISRKHVIERSRSGVWYVLGGKYTTYRAIAREAIKHVFPGARLSDTQVYALYGSGEVRADVKQLTLRFGVAPDTVSYLISLYGSRYWDVLKLIDEDASLRVRIAEGFPAIRAQAAYALKTEKAVSAEDIYLRRLQLQYTDAPKERCLQSIEDVISTYAC